MVDASEGSFVDAEAYQGGGNSKEALTFPLIVLFHVQRCASLGAADHAVGGYWSEKESISRTGAPSVSIYSYYESKGKTFENAVVTLHDLLFSHADNSLSESFGKYETDIKAVGELYDKEIENAKQEGLIENLSLMNLQSKYCAARAQAARPLFRACLTWLKKNNYLANDSYEEGLEE